MPLACAIFFHLGIVNSNDCFKISFTSEGTRSVKLSEGKSGLAQLALYSKAKVVPVGCNGSDLVFTGNLPFAKKGEIIYRFGDPLTVEDKLKHCRIDDKFELFSSESQEKYKENFEEATRITMREM